MIFDGFWLPVGLRGRALAGATWETYWLRGGVTSREETAGAIAVRWPRLAPTEWRGLLTELGAARRPAGQEALARWQAALEGARGRLLADAATIIPALAACTGYSPEMLMAALWQGDLISIDFLLAALQFQPTWATATRWERMPGLAGQIRFFPAGPLDRITASLRGRAPLCRPAPRIELALGYAAGNVPGTALLIALLGGLANQAAGDAVTAPAVVVRNSRHEPLFAPWLLAAVEAIDPELVAGLAVLIWDYDEAAIQREVLARAGLMIAAAGDYTIAALDAQCTQFAPNLRFHRHGHKVSFAVIEALETGSWKLETGSQRERANPQSAFRNPHSAIPRLAAVDSSLWDQNGCLSARIHFVAGDADGYAQALTGQMRELAATMPRGTTPRRFIHRAFDTFKTLEGLGDVQVFSGYDDDFAVIRDRRPWDAERVARAANACMGRVTIVRPVRDVLDAPGYLRWLPPANLQSVSVAMDGRHVLEFADAAGACGVTAIRSLGRAAFPQLAYSWDGLLPLDVAHLRPAGHFSTVEFDDLAGELAETASRWE